MANNTIVISRIQHRRGRRENLPQPLRPGELALTGDTQQVWIGGQPDQPPYGTRVHSDKDVTLGRVLINTKLAAVRFNEAFVASDFTSFVSYLTASSVPSMTITENDIEWDQTYRGEILSVSIDTPGTGYTPGQLIPVVSPVGSGASIEVSTVGGSGEITSVHIIAGGRNYTASSTTLNTGGIGNGDAVITVSSSDILGYTVYVAVDPVVDANNTFINLDTSLTNSPVASKYLTSNPLGLLQSIVLGGTGYISGDILTVSGGTFSTAAQIEVVEVDTGVITRAVVTDPGSYSVKPSNPVSVTGGSGSGATFDLAFNEFDTSGFLSLNNNDAGASVATLLNRLAGDQDGYATSVQNIELGTIVTGSGNEFPYELPFYFNGATNIPNLLYVTFVFSQTATLLSPGSSSVAYANVASAANQTFDLQKNGVSFGSVTFTTGNMIGTVSIPTDTSFIKNDRLDIIGDSSPDNTIDQIAITLVGRIIV